MPAGAHGVVMAAYADGRAYEVEFEAPQHVVLTLEGQYIQARASSPRDRPKGGGGASTWVQAGVDRSRG
jgi:hypothetical protein